MNIKQSIRILFRNKIYSILNIAGLTLGIASAALLLLWMEDELSYNRKFSKSDRLYTVWQIQHFDKKHNLARAVSNLISEALASNYPGIKNVTRYFPKNMSFSTEEDIRLFSEGGNYADPTIFDMIDLRFVQGDPDKVFEPANAIVISREMAKKFFGDDDPIGKSLVADKTDVYQVTGVFEEPPVNSSFRFRWLIPFSSLLAKMPHLADSRDNFMNCYVELESSANPDALNRQLLSYYTERGDSENTSTLFLFPITRMHLYEEFDKESGIFTGSGEIRKIRLFACIAAIILLIACINFMNLSTARAQRRAMEVGVRKTFGGKRHALISQFIGESAVITFIALILAVFIVWVTLPFFNSLINKNLEIQLFAPEHLLGLLGLGVICTLLAGSYPAFYLSSFKPIVTLKGMKIRAGNVAWIRKGLVVFQFAIAYILICATAVVYLQIRHVLKRPMGYNREQVIRITAEKPVKDSFEALDNELRNTGYVVSSALTDHPMVNIFANGWGYRWPGKDPNNETLIWQLFVSEGLVETLQMNLQEGRDFRPGTAVDYESVIINRCLADMMGEEGRTSGRLGRGSWDNPKEVIGVVDDLVFNNVFSTVPRPMVISKAIAGDSYGSARYLFIRLKPQTDLQTGLKKIEEVIRHFNPEDEFAYSFMDEDFGRLVNSEKLTGTLASLFAALAILISCLGIFGLSAFSAEQRTKEIGIRKILGASVWDMINLLGRSFMTLILFSFVISIPAAWYISHHWLQDYDYRISIGWYIFAAVGLLVLCIAILTVSAQSLKAATANPVKAIKTE